MRNRPSNIWIILAWAIGVSAAKADGPPLERIAVGGSPLTFVAVPSGRAFRAWGFNYDRDARGRLIEDYWQDEWAKVEADFARMKAMGANVVRVHLQLGRFLPEPDRVDPAQLDQLGRLLALAERLGLYLDLTGLGCYRKADVPGWYDGLGEAGRWQAQARFWSAVAGRASKSPAVFCYDLMNEPVVPGDRQEARDWLGSGPGLDGKFYVQKITLDPAGRPRAEVARLWMVPLRDAIRRADPGRLITIGLVDWSLDRPGALFSGITPEAVAAELDFNAVHLYPEAGKVADALNTLGRFQVGGKPVVVEETFPLRCPIADFARFADAARDSTAGLVGFYWGQDRTELKKVGTIAASMTDQWLDYFEKAKRPAAPEP